MSSDDGAGDDKCWMDWRAVEFEVQLLVEGVELTPQFLMDFFGNRVVGEQVITDNDGVIQLDV